MVIIMDGRLQLAFGLFYDWMEYTNCAISLGGGYKKQAVDLRLTELMNNLIYHSNHESINTIIIEMEKNKKKHI
jgi:hypothetical protein